MDKKTSIDSVEKCLTALQSAIEAFQSFLGTKTSTDTSSYYQAQDHLNAGIVHYKDSLDEISKIVGTLPANASPAYKTWRESFLERIGILIHNTEFEALRSELQNDAFLLGFMTPEEIDVLLVKHFESQQTGKRKLANIKARMLFDQIQNLKEKAQNLSEKSKERLYQLR